MNTVGSSVERLKSKKKGKHAFGSPKETAQSGTREIWKADSCEPKEPPAGSYCEIEQLIRKHDVAFNERFQSPVLYCEFGRTVAEARILALGVLGISVNALTGWR